jgi:hypothetical protein
MESTGGDRDKGGRGGEHRGGGVARSGKVVGVKSPGGCGGNTGSTSERGREAGIGRARGRSTGDAASTFASSCGPGGDGNGEESLHESEGGTRCPSSIMTSERR